MPKISVITPTIRELGLDIVKKALSRQTFKSFEWIIVSPFDPKIGVWVKDPGKNEGDVWSLNKAYNAGIKKAKGDLIVSWQDYTFADPDVLERFYFHFQNEPKTLVTGVGNKYKDVYPQLGEMTWKDPRERTDQGTFYPCNFSDVEWNFCAVPKQALYDIGGFDESSDQFFGMDGYGVNERLWDYGGYDFKIDQAIRSYSLPHDRDKDWEEFNAIHGAYQAHKWKLVENRQYPVLNYL